MLHIRSQDIVVFIKELLSQLDIRPSDIFEPADSLPAQVGRLLDELNGPSVCISYASEDSKFVEQLRQDLERHGMKCWVATDDLQTGQKFRQAIDDAIQKHGLVLVVLSSSSIKSSWVEKEVETAMELERRLNRT